MDFLGLILQLASGAVGGNVTGSLLKNMTLGRDGNSLAGAIGGLLGGNVLNSALGLSTAAGAAGPDIGDVISQIVGSGIGGGAIMVFVSLLRQAFAKP